MDSRQRVNFSEGDHLYANLGPARIPYHHRTILGYCKEFGVGLEVFTNDNRAALFHNRERFDGRPVSARRVITDIRGYIAELLAKAVDGASLDSALTVEDKERLLQMLVKYGDLNADHLYKGTKRGGYRGERLNAGLKAGELDDPLDFSDLLKSDFWEYKLHFDDFLDQNPTLLQPVGGMDTIAKAFEERVGSFIRYRSVVEEIRKKPEGRPHRLPVRIGRRSRRSGRRFCHLLHTRSRPEGHSKRFCPGDEGRDRIGRVRSSRQNRFSDAPALLGGGSRHLRRYLVDRPGHHADLVSAIRISSRQRGDRRCLYLEQGHWTSL